MKDSLKRFLIGNKSTAQLLYRFYRLKNGNAAAAESERRKNISLFETEQLCADIPYSPQEVVIDNNLYGQAFALKRFAKIKDDLQAYIEHGLFWGGMVHQDEYHWYTSRIITFSEQRKKDIAAKGITDEVVCVGPYMNYAKPLFTAKERLSLKEKLGTTLLVFPSKSILNIESKYDVDAFINEVKRVGKDYKTILVSLYFLDARNPQLREAYKAHGFKIVTAGHRYDNYFLDRQRSFIELADMTMSNEVGTHVGYCTHLNKPHYIYQQELKRVASSKKELARELTLYESEEDQRRNAEKAEVARAFSTFNAKTITEEQRNVINKFWGTSSAKSPDELQQLLA